MLTEMGSCPSHAHHPCPPPIPGPSGAGEAPVPEPVHARCWGLALLSTPRGSLPSSSPGAGPGRRLVSTGSPFWEGDTSVQMPPGRPPEGQHLYLSPQPLPTPDQPGTAQALRHPPRSHLWAILSGQGADRGSWLFSSLKFFFKGSSEWPAKLSGERPPKKVL